MGETPEKSEKEVKGLSQCSRRRQEIIHLKILVPSIAVGAIIGKGGESIAKIQKETGARIKLSKVNDLYPGTEERVCLIQGTLEGVTRMHNYIMDCVLEKPECSDTPGTVVSCVTTSTAPASHSESIAPSSTALDDSGHGVAHLHKGSTWTHGLESSGNRLPWGRHKQVKILVPNCTAGLVIGKLGSYVREIKDRTGAFIQISQKSVEINLLERCITIAGEPDQCRAAVDLVLAKIAEDPQSAIYPVISYSHVRGPVASAYPTGSPFAIMPAVRFPPCQASHLQLPPGRGVSGGGIEAWDGNAPGGVGFSPVSNPFGSSLFQAALLQFQAAAIAANLSPTNYYPTLSPVDATAADMSTLTAHGLSTNISYMPSEDPSIPQPALPDYGQGLYSSTPTANVPLFGGSGGASGSGANPSGASGGPGGTLIHEGGWPVAESQIQTPACYDAAYPAPLNFAFYPANQSLLSAIASRHPSESYQSRGDVFAQANPYMTAISQQSFTIPYTTAPSLVGSTGGNPVGVPQIDPGSAHLATLYPGMSPLCLSQQYPTSVASEMDVKVPPVGQQSPSLNELLSSLRLSCNTEDVVSEINQAFSTLSHHGFLNLAGAGPFPLISPTGSQPPRYISPLFATHPPSSATDIRSSTILPDDASVGFFPGVRSSTVCDTGFINATRQTAPSYSDASSSFYPSSQSFETPISKQTQPFSEPISQYQHHHSAQSSCSQSSGCGPCEQEEKSNTFRRKSHDTQFCETATSLSADVDGGNDGLSSCTGHTEVTVKQSTCSPKDIVCCSCADSSSSIHTPASSPSFGSCTCSNTLSLGDQVTQCEQSKPTVTTVPSSTKVSTLQGSKKSSNNNKKETSQSNKNEADSHFYLISTAYFKKNILKKSALTVKYHHMSV
ncbi:unnamed protein product [Trichobilharzia szidati]|nr:unnamed protein product [Trichobilharzia szidati]